MIFPAPVIEEHGDVLVVRDDLIPGGTKARIVWQFLGAAEEWVYASPAYGYAQIALAHSCAALGKQATIFTAKRAALHPRTAEARRAGAKIVQVPYGYLSNVKAKAKAYADTTRAGLLPFGFDFPEFTDGLAAIARDLPVKPSEVWTVAGSGTLSRALQTAWPSADFYAVKVGATPNAGRASLYTAPESFEREARIKPPFPSTSNYDAKAWQFVRRYAAPGALFWNVAA